MSVDQCSPKKSSRAAVRERWSVIRLVESAASRRKLREIRVTDEYDWVDRNGITTRQADHFAADRSFDGYSKSKFGGAWRSVVDRGLQRWQTLAARLKQLQSRLRIAFAAGCAERALAVLEYEAYSENPRFLAAFQEAVEVVWQAATGVRVLAGDLAHARAAVEEVFPKGDYYDGYGNTVSAGAGVLRALEAIEDSSCKPVTDVSLHVSSAYAGVTECDAVPTDDLDWQELAVGRLEMWVNRPVTRAIFNGLPPPASEGFGVL